MPMRRNVQFGTQAEHENTRTGQDISWFDEDKWTLSKRVDQIMTGIHWAEEPLSRVSLMLIRRRRVGLRRERGRSGRPSRRRRGSAASCDKSRAQFLR